MGEKNSLMNGICKILRRIDNIGPSDVTVCYQWRDIIITTKIYLSIGGSKFFGEYHIHFSNPGHVRLPIEMLGRCSEMIQINRIDGN